jgi:prepilin signal peptidase PulO-like enzyme (type II secretory pathway)
VVNVVAGATIGALMAPLVYLLATVLLTGPGRIPRTPVVLAALLASCIAAGVAITTSASIAAGESSFTGLVTVVGYGLFAVGVLAAALVDVIERRIPNRITYPLIVIGVLGLPWLAQPVSGWALLAPLLGAVVSGVIGLLNALLADQGLGDVKLAVAVGAWMAHLGLLAWVTGVLVGQLLMIGAVASTQIRRRLAGLPPDYTPLGPSLAGGAVLAVAVAGLQF